MVVHAVVHCSIGTFECEFQAMGPSTVFTIAVILASLLHKSINRAYVTIGIISDTRVNFVCVIAVDTCLQLSDSASRWYYKMLQISTRPVPCRIVFKPPSNEFLKAHHDECSKTK